MSMKRRWKGAKKQGGDEVKLHTTAAALKISLILLASI
jgi:hypothetical protein